MLWAVATVLTVTLVSAPEFRTLENFHFPDLFLACEIALYASLFTLFLQNYR